MEIQKAKELRDKLQEDILSLIQKFEEDTKTNVRYVDLDFVESAQNPLPNTIGVLVDFKF